MTSREVVGNVIDTQWIVIGGRGFISGDKRPHWSVLHSSNQVILITSPIRN
jgi:hypothetical protein